MEEIAEDKESKTSVTTIKKDQNSLLEEVGINLYLCRSS